MKTHLFDVKDLTPALKDLANYPREAGPDWRAAMDIASAMKTGSVMPPPAVAMVNGKLTIVDGWHRIIAAKSLKVKLVKCEYLGKTTSMIAFAEAVKRNISHGKKLSWHERLVASQKLRGANWSWEQIQDIVRVPITDLKRGMTDRTLRTDHTDVIVKSSLEHIVTDGRHHSITELDGGARLANPDQVRLVEELLIHIKSRWLNRRDKVLWKRLRELYLLLRPLMKQEIHP